MINTIHGDIHESLLEKRIDSGENENEFWQAVEYWLDNVLVHRSADVQLKTGIVIDASIASLG